MLGYIDKYSQFIIIRVIFLFDNLMNLLRTVALFKISKNVTLWMITNLCYQKHFYGLTHTDSGYAALV